MPLDKITITDVDLGRVDPMFLSTRPGYSKSATLVFTNGKAEALWKSTSPQAFGATFPSFISVDETAKKCAGMCLIDLFTILSKCRTPAWTSGRQKIPARLSPDYFRYLTVISIVHELMHVCQGWQIGKRFGRDFLEEEISAANRADDYSAVNPDMQNSPYLQNMFESGARNFAERWGNTHADEVHRGKFDFLLPMAVMRGIFPDVPNVYR